MKMMTDHHDLINAALEVNESINGINPPTLYTPEKFTESNEVFENLMNKMGNETKIVIAKSFILNELKHHVPTLKDNKNTHVNTNNTMISDIMKLLTRLTDSDDIAFIQNEFSRQEMILNEADKSNEGGHRKHLSIEDRLCFIIILATADTVRAAYLSCTNGMSRTGVDYQNSEKGEADWKELLCERFNEESGLLDKEAAKPTQ